MASTKRTRIGIQAGLLAGASVAILFLVLDMAQMRPLATPFALSAHLLGPASPALEFPVISQLVGIVIFAGNILALSILHFLAFSLLGIGAVWGCDRCRVPLNVVTGALFGITVGTMVFYACISFCGEAVLADLPGPMNVVLANLAAGAVMGGFVQATQARNA